MLGFGEIKKIEAVPDPRGCLKSSVEHTIRKLEAGEFTHSEAFHLELVKIFRIPEVLESGFFVFQTSQVILVYP